jgi:DNA invertase Pin-like site-specific DNA recombinase
MLKYFMYCRKSSEDEDRQMLSIDAQISELRSIAAANGMAIVNVFTESKSAKEPGRAIFNDMLRRIECGEANAILSWKLDRLARNFDDGGKIIGLLQRGVIQEIRTFEKTYLPGDNVLMIAVEFGMANQYVRDLSVNIQRGIREKIRRGVFCGKAPLGYYNEPRLRTIEPHPKNFGKVKKILEAFATGKFSQTAIQKQMAKAGLVGFRTKKPPRLNTISNMLQNPFYYGVFAHKGELHQGAHIPMISKKTFDDIQEALVVVGKPRHNRKEKNFLFRHFATCGSCGYSITAERHTKKSGLRFRYYRCTDKNKTERCENRSYVPEERFAEEVKRNAQLVTIPDEWREKFLARIETWESEVSHEKQQKIDQLKAELFSLKAKIDRINNGFTEGSIDIDEFKELKNPLVPKKVELEQQIIGLEKSKGNRLEPLRKWVLRANALETAVSSNDWLEMKSFLHSVGSNRLLRAQTLTVSFKKPFDLLAETNLAVRSTHDVFSQSSLWWCLLQKVRTVLDENPDILPPPHTPPHLWKGADLNPSFVRKDF